MKKHPKALFTRGKEWWAMTGSNRRPPRCKPVYHPSNLLILLHSSTLAFPINRVFWGPFRAFAVTPCKQMCFGGGS